MNLSEWLKSRGISPKCVVLVSAVFAGALAVAIRGGGVYVGTTGNEKTVDPSVVTAPTQTYQSQREQAVKMRAALPEFSDIVKLPEELQKKFDKAGEKLWADYAKEQYGRRRYDEAQAYKGLCGLLKMSAPGASNNLDLYLSNSPSEESKMLVLALACVCDDQHNKVSYLVKDAEARETIAQVAQEILNSDGFAKTYMSERFAKAFPGLLQKFTDTTYYLYEHDGGGRPQVSENPGAQKLLDGTRRPGVEENPQRIPASGRPTQVDENPADSHELDNTNRPKVEPTPGAGRAEAEMEM